VYLAWLNSVLIEEFRTVQKHVIPTRMGYCLVKQSTRLECCLTAAFIGLLKEHVEAAIVLPPYAVNLYVILEQCFKHGADIYSSFLHPPRPKCSARMSPPFPRATFLRFLYLSTYTSFSNNISNTALTFTLRFFVTSRPKCSARKSPPFPRATFLRSNPMALRTGRSCP
jgi:hypothetical protein